MIKRVKRNNKLYIVGYHTQEFREMDQPLTKPIKCRHHQAWLGFGYYFWTGLEFAHYWGVDSKNRTGYYDIYRAEIEEEHLLDATFSEEGYFFFKESIEKVIESFEERGLKVTLGEVQRYLVDVFWPKHGVTGIIYDDLPQKVDFPGRTYSPIPPLYYKKRIQIVVFNSKNISSFELELEAQPC